MHSLAVRLGALALSVGMCVLVSAVDPFSGVAYADSVPAPVTDPVVDPDAAPGTLDMSGFEDTITLDGIADASGVDAAAEIGGTLCAVGGVETAGIACIAGGVLTLGAAVGGASAAKWLIHTAWGPGHNAAPPDAGAGFVWATEYQPGYEIGVEDGSCAFGGSTGAFCEVIAADPSNVGPTTGDWLNESFRRGDAGLTGAAFGTPTNWDGTLPVGEPVFGAEPGAGLVGACFTDPATGAAIAGWGDVSTLEPCASASGVSSGTHQWESTVECNGPDHTVETQASSVFTDTDTTPADIPIPQCPAGDYASSFSVADSPGPGATSLTAGGPASYTSPTDPSYTKCLPGGADAPCTLRFQEVLLPKTSGGVTFPDPDPSPIPTNTPEPIGTEGLDWINCTTPGNVECAPLADPTNDAYIEAHPNLQTVVYPDAAYGGWDEYRAVWGPYNVPLKDGLDAGSLTAPTSSTGTSGSTATSDQNECFPSGWAAFDPLDWVYDPVKCVLEWAFEPNEAQVKTETQAATSAWANTPPAVAWGTVATLATAMIPATGATSDCAGPLFSTEIPGFDPAHVNSQHLAFHPFDMCNAFGLWAHRFLLPFGTALVLITAAITCAHIIGGTIGYRPPIDHGDGESV